MNKMDYSIKDALISCKDAANTIMDNIENILTNNNYEYITNSSNSEIIIDKKCKKELTKLFNNELKISNYQIKILIDICETKKRTYIRKKYK
jgi:hypothetical protein